MNLWSNFLRNCLEDPQKISWRKIWWNSFMKSKEIFSRIPWEIFLLNYMKYLWKNLWRKSKKNLYKNPGHLKKLQIENMKSISWKILKKSLKCSWNNYWRKPSKNSLKCLFGHRWRNKYRKFLKLKITDRDET